MDKERVVTLLITTTKVGVMLIVVVKKRGFTADRHLG
jgi:hypothetical protein